MTNHVRTLLRNLGTAADYSIPLAEYAPASKVVRLPTDLATIWKTLFGTSPDAHGIEYRLRQYMELAHASSLADRITAADSRITYLPFEDRIDEVPFRVRIAPVGHEEPLFFGGSPPVEQGGALHYAWTVMSIDGGSKAYVRRDSPNPGDEEFPITYVAGLSVPFKLIGSDLTGRFYDGQADGTAWSVEYVARPKFDVGDVVAQLDAAGEAAMSALFGTSPGGDMKVFRDTWRSEAPLPDRLTAILLALAARMDGLRMGRPPDGR